MRKMLLSAAFLLAFLGINSCKKENKDFVRENPLAGYKWNLMSTKVKYTALGAVYPAPQPAYEFISNTEGKHSDKDNNVAVSRDFTYHFKADTLLLVGKDYTSYFLYVPPANRVLKLEKIGQGLNGQRPEYYSNPLVMNLQQE
jgi:hypothetical protein